MAWVSKSTEASVAAAAAAGTPRLRQQPKQHDWEFKLDLAKAVDESLKDATPNEEFSISSTSGSSSNSSSFFNAPAPIVAPAMRINQEEEMASAIRMENSARELPSRSFLDSYRSKLSKDGVKLLNDFVKNNEGLIGFRRAFDFMFEELKQQFPAPPIRFINFNDFSGLDCLPRYPDNANITCSLDSIDRSCSFLVFISHCWLRGRPGTDEWDGKAHPDNKNNLKFKLCINGIPLLKQIHAPRVKNCYVWIDFGCMDQDNKDKMSEELEHYDRIIQLCDCLFTPEIQFWDIQTRAYLERAWCRVEMMYAAVLPVQNGSEERCTLFDAGLAFHLSQNRRAHIVYDESCLIRGQYPRIFPPLQFPFGEYNPLKGVVSFEADKQRIENLMGELNFATRVAEYVGETNDEGIPQGNGKMKYGNGDEYEGEWQHGKRCGHGQYRSADGELYLGEWKDGNKHGYGTLQCTNGDTYTGDWKNGMKDGLGTYRYANRAMYEGKWKDDMKNGLGSYRYANGDEYRGEWKDGKKHGAGAFQGNNGAVYEGKWKEDSWCHGSCHAEGGEYEEDLNDKKHGQEVVVGDVALLSRIRFSDGLRLALLFQLAVLAMLIAVWASTLW